MTLCVASETRGQSFDRGFDPGGATTYVVNAFVVQPDGKILAGESYLEAPFGFSKGVMRVNRDGSIDAGFHTDVGDMLVYQLAIQPDGKILVGGESARAVVRLNADGSLDTSFNTVVIGSVHALAVQPDGKVVIGGVFTSGGGPPTTRYIARLNADGSLDTGFGPTANGDVKAVAVQVDGKILIGGTFFELRQGGNTIERNYIARLSTDGGVDSDFNPGANDTVLTLAIQADGRIIAGVSSPGLEETERLPVLTLPESIPTVHSMGRSRVLPTANVIAVLVQPDGKILCWAARSATPTATSTSRVHTSLA